MVNEKSPYPRVLLKLKIRFMEQALFFIPNQKKMNCHAKYRIWFTQHPKGKERKLWEMNENRRLSRFAKIADMMLRFPIVLSIRITDSDMMDAYIGLMNLSKHMLRRVHRLACCGIWIKSFA